ncbi:alpha/beta fold hydrolase [Pseudonocardia spinosispora]|uniref:alpha/beta fold hydrolase n=1 Tax=Pseudonocardia spinosispora TaxID=103441 RepID=UPI00041E8837|nr:alpha/beta hydrolase [Pseudonocardia spinosispora]
MSQTSHPGPIESLGPPSEPGLSSEFRAAFESVLVTTPRIRLHAVVGGHGPALLLINGWPQTWYAWRHVMLALAAHFTVVAAEPRGMGRSDKPRDGYDTGSMAEDLVTAMRALGYEEFAVLGHDVGMWIGYALASDHSERVTRLAVAEATIPGVSAEPPFFGPSRANERLFHFAFNRLDGINEELVQGRESLYFGHQFATKAAVELEPHAVAVYVAALASSRAALSGSFGPYRAIDETVRQNQERRRRALSHPVLAVAGSESLGELVGLTMSAAARGVESSVLAGCGHYPAEECPAAFLDAVLPFLRGVA